jgi:hypothetical protein
MRLSPFSDATAAVICATLAFGMAPARRLSSATYASSSFPPSANAVSASTRSRTSSPLSRRPKSERSASFRILPRRSFSFLSTGSPAFSAALRKR